MTRAVLAWTMDKLNQGYSVAIATIIDSKGSVPGKPGAKLALIKNGEKYGTVGGGWSGVKNRKSSNQTPKRTKTYVFKRRGD